MDIVKWGIIGCGDVTERKSGPAFNKVADSTLVAVMRRNEEKAKDYASRHGVPKWYTDASALINDPEVNAIYIATPPSSHEDFTMAALAAGKPVYLEKPMALDQNGCLRMMKASDAMQVKLVVAHYRRALPLYIKVRELLEQGAIGNPRFINLEFLQAPAPAAVKPEVNWRVDPSISGGGLFHDLSPHQLDLMLYYSGRPVSVSGFSSNQAGLYPAEDIVSGRMIFQNGLIFQGLWCFTVAHEDAADRIQIVGSTGQIIFSLTGSDIVLRQRGKQKTLSFTHPENIQLPMIQEVVNYFRERGDNPCSGTEAADGMRIIDAFTAR